MSTHTQTINTYYNLGGNGGIRYMIGAGPFEDGNGMGWCNGRHETEGPYNNGEGHGDGHGFEGDGTGEGR